MAKDAFAGLAGFGVGLGLYFLFRNLGRDGAGLRLPAPPSSIPLASKDEFPLLFWMFNPADFNGLSKLADPLSRARINARFLQIDLGKEELTLPALRARVADRLRRDPDYKSSPSETIDDVILRVKAGGRDDVRLMTSQATVSGTWADVKDALRAAGIRHWELGKEAPVDRDEGAFLRSPHWNLFDKGKAPDLNPDKKGHYRFEPVGTAYWNLVPEASHVSQVSGFAGGRFRNRGHFRRGRYW